MADVPAPPAVSAPLPWVGAGLGLLRNPTAFFARQRARHGDTFTVNAFGVRLFCVFSAEGVRSLYALPEHRASFGLATYTLIRTKVPDELFSTIRNTPHKLFGSQHVEHYLANLEQAVDAEIDRLGRTGTFEIFAEMRRLGHRLGLASWAGHEAASTPYIERLIPMFDALDSSDSFVRPAQQLVTWATRKRRERAAMLAIESVIAEIWAARRASGTVSDDFLSEIYESFSDVDEATRDGCAARDVIVLHMGSQSNLYAALAWTLVNLLLHPDLATQVREGDDRLLERCAYESIRIAQRSITLRQVIKPVEVEDGHRTYRVEPGTMVATMLSVTNSSAAPGLDVFDPAHYEGRRLRVDLPAKELVSTFGHGVHTCPAQRFSISAIRISVRRLLEAYDFTPQFTTAQPRSRQLGGVARAQRPCVATYSRRR